MILMRRKVMDRGNRSPATRPDKGKNGGQDRPGESVAKNREELIECAAEIRRRLTAVYEDFKIKQNGDVE